MNSDFNPLVLERRGVLIPVHPNRHVVPTEVATVIGAAGEAARRARREQVKTFVLSGDHAPRKGAVHARCAGCHVGTAGAVAMTSCATCHTPAVGAPKPPALAPPLNTAPAIFSHARHAARPHGARRSMCRYLAQRCLGRI